MPKGIPVLYTHDGKTLSLKGWSNETGIPHSTIHARISAGRNPFDGRSCKSRQRNLPIEIDGESLTLTQWSELSGVPYQTITYRFRVGDRGRELLRPPGSPKASPCTLKPFRVTMPAPVPVPVPVPVAPSPHHGRRPYIKLTLMGETMSVDEWAVELDIEPETIRRRIRRGLTHEECLSKAHLAGSRPKPLTSSTLSPKRHPMAPARLVMRVPSLAEVDAGSFRLAA